MSSETSVYDFSSILSQVRLHMTNPFSTTSTDPSFMCFYFDQLGNMALYNCHSRDVFTKGFVVDNKSPCCLDVCKNDYAKLVGSVDEQQMVENLSAFQ